MNKKKGAKERNQLLPAPARKKDHAYGKGEITGKRISKLG